MKVKFFPCLVLLSIFCACQKNPPYSAREIGARSAGAITQERFIKEADARVDTIKAIGSAILIKDDKEWQTDIAVAIVPPDRARLEAFDSIADVWAAAGIDGAKMWLWFPQKKKLYRGSSSIKNIKKFANINATASDLISIMSGLVPNARLAEFAEISKKEKHYAQTSKPIHVWIKKRRPFRIVGYKESEYKNLCADSESTCDIQYEADFDDFKKIDSHEFPYRIEMKFPPESTSRHGSKSATFVTLKFSEVIMNEKIDSSIFKPEDVWQALKGQAAAVDME